MASPRICLSMGDPCGIGPEIILKAFAAGELAGCTVVGDTAVLRRAADQLGLTAVRVEQVEGFDVAPPDASALPVWLVPGLGDLLAVPEGQVHAQAGLAAARSIEQATRAVLAGEAQAIVTAPIHKEALAAAGVPYPGHTEMLQALAATDGIAPPVRMMLANEQLRVVLVTIHVALRTAIEALDFQQVLQTLRITHQSAAAWGVPHPRIAVAGLNPHAGEGGLFGDEEIRFIAPAIQAARAEGINAQGPFAPDTVFMRARHAPPTKIGEFDVVVAMTHDHGLIPVKYLGVDEGVNVTLGLPFVRTSPDHGTAFDIAGTGKASAASLIAAVRMARNLVRV